MSKEEKEYSESVKPLEKLIGYKFKDYEILKLALTHKSYVGIFNLVRHSNTRNNERLEFLGDSILGYVVTDFIFKKYLNLKEGELSEIRSHIVCKKSLSDIARGLELHKYLIYGKGITEGEIKLNDSVLENTVEALIGAIYLDGGLDKASKFVYSFILPQEGNIELKALKDSKSRLQEILQASGNAHIEYIVSNVSGPDHDRFFEVEVYNNGKRLGEGSGKNKKLAEQEAAKQALIKLER